MIKNLLDDNDDSSAESPEIKKTARPPAVIGLFDSVEDEQRQTDEPFVLSTTQPDSLAETARRSGLAWSMGVVFVGSVVFMLVLGWGADLLFGSSPWGIVIGIVIGSIIGFVQFFRISSQIFKK